MPLDAICLSGLCKELKSALIGGRIDKVQQPERDILLISLRSQGRNLRLLVACGSGNARVHLTESSFDNPSEPPMFCMLMRKHLVGARILDVEQPDMERMLIIKLQCHDELGFETEKCLVAELIGRSSNLVLVGDDGRIIDCMRRMDFAGDPLRRMLPGMIYRLPPKQDKTPFFGTDSDQRADLITKVDKASAPDKWLMDTFSGLSPLVCRELSVRCGGSFDTLAQQMDALYDTVVSCELSPTMIYVENKPRDISFMNIMQYGVSARTEIFENFSTLLDAFYSKKDRIEQQRRRSHELNKNVRTLRDRLQRKLNTQYEELKRTESREEVRKRAELLTANLYRVRKGDRRLLCEDYYQEGSPQIEISLDPLKTPQQNSAALFKEYNKLKGAEKHLTVLIEEGESRLDYLNSVLDVIERAETEKDLSDIRRELIESGFIKKAKGTKPDKIKAQSPLRFISDEGLEILVGRNNRQNDELSTKFARRTDYWLHTQKVHGSHVIIRCDGLEPDPTSLEQAASLAVYYSQGREAGKTAVDCTMVRNVRKPSGSLPGKVIYSDYFTLNAQADEELVRRLQRK